MTIVVGRRVVLAALAAGWPFAARGQKPAIGRTDSGNSQAPTIRDQLVGSWELISVTSNFERQSFLPSQSGPMTTLNDAVQPYGPNPRGRLSLERNGQFASTILNSSGSRPASTDGVPVEFEASTGTYSLHPSRPKTLVFDIEASDHHKLDEQYVEIKNVTTKYLEFTTSAPPGGGWYSSFVYRRAE